MKQLLDTWSIKLKLGAAFGAVLLVLLAASMGFYLKSGEEGHKALYLKDNRNLATTIATTGNLLRRLGDEGVLQGYSELVAKVERFSGYEARILELTDSDAHNMPAMAWPSSRSIPVIWRSCRPWVKCWPPNRRHRRKRFPI